MESQRNEKLFLLDFTLVLQFLVKETSEDA